MPRLGFQQVVAAFVVAGGLAAGMVSVTGQEPRPVPPDIPSLAEAGQGLAVKARSDKNGLVTFATAAGRGVLLPGMAAAPADARALAFVDAYGAAFGLQSRNEVRLLGAPQTDALGFDHVKLQQVHGGVGVTAGELIVHLKGDRVMAANGHTLSDLPALVSPSLAPPLAIEQAELLIAKHEPNQADGARYGEPRLELFNRGMIDEGTYPTRLAWFVEVTGEALREYVWIDAHSGAVLLNFSQRTDARNRTVYDAGLGSTLPGTLVRTETGPPTGIPDADLAHLFAGHTYDYYLSNHGRDSFDNAGGEIRSTVRYRQNPSVPYQNAFWNGTQMVYGEGYASADDVVGHELTHAVVDRSANLLYYYQSGALNESFADIFGETVDLLNGAGTDTPAMRWQLAEDLSIGAIRNMMNPNAFDHPGRVSDPDYFCRSDAWTNPNSDSGGVHINSGVPNHAFALMVDGGAYNGRTVTGIGLIKATKIQYRVLTTYLTSGSTFADNANGLGQACSDLLGQFGITANDCAQVALAVQAVEMSNPTPCSGATPPPVTYCPAGGTPAALFADSFESGGANWTPSSTTADNWIPSDTDFAKTGLRMAYGPDGEAASDHRLAMTSAVTLPANARLSFDHAFEFEHGTAAFYDGGVLEYSTNGTTWNDAGALIDGGQAYAGVLSAGNVLGARNAFVRSSFGYTASRLNLASLAGQPVRFRFRIGTDTSVGSFGWVVDNFRIYTCGAGPGPGPGPEPQPPTGLEVASIVGNTVTLRWASPAGGVAPTGYVLEGGTAPGQVLASLPTGSTAPVYRFVAPTGSFYVRVHTLAGTARSAASNEILIHVNVPVAPSAPANLLGLVNGRSIALAWKNTYTGGPPASVLLDVTGPVTTTIPLGATESFQFPSVPIDGTYTFSLRAANGGGPSPSSNSVTLTFPGACSGAPQAPTNFVAYNVGATIFVLWDPPAGGAAPTTYVLSASGGAVNVSIPTTGRALSGTVGAGTYSLSVRAANACGSGPATAVQTITIQ